MLDRGKNGKVIIYLDQFAVSNMLDAKEGSLWHDIRLIILEKVTEGKLLCPLSIEHTFETSQKTRGNACLHELFYQNISNNYTFRDFSSIVANQINILIRKYCKTSIDTFLCLKYLNLSDDKTYFNINKEFGSLKKKSNDDYKLHNKICRDGGIRNILIKSGEIGRINLLKIMESKNIDSFIGNIKQTINLISKGELNNRDLNPIVCKLLGYHHFTKNELVSLANELERNGYENIASLYIHNKLLYLSAVNGSKMDFNDQIDIDRISIGLPYSDYLFCDFKHKKEILQLQLDKKYNTQIFTAKTDDLESFLDIISK